MFVRPRPKKSLLPPPAKRRKTTPSIEEINFDFDARADYLTGFHKRKLQRSKQAQEEAAKKAKEERIAARKKVHFNSRYHWSYKLIILATRRSTQGVGSTR